MEAHELTLSKLLSLTPPYLTGLQWRKRLQERLLVIFWMSLVTASATVEKREPGPVKSPSKLKLSTCQCLPSRVTKYRIPYCTLNSYIGREFQQVQIACLPFCCIQQEKSKAIGKNQELLFPPRFRRPPWQWQTFFSVCDSCKLTWGMQKGLCYLLPFQFVVSPFITTSTIFCGVSLS